MFEFLKELFLSKKQQPPNTNCSFLNKQETDSRRRKLYETVKTSDSSHEVQSGIYFNLSPDNLNRFQSAFVGAIFRPKTNNGALLYPNEEKFIYLIELNTDEKLGPVFYESKVFSSFKEAETDRWALKSKIYNKSVQEVKEEEEKKEAETNPYYYFNCSKRLYDSGSYDPEDLKSHLNIAVTKNISPNSKAWGYKVLGNIYMDHNEIDEAKNCFEKALSLNPKVGVKNLLKKLSK